MGSEIERKFLLRNDLWRKNAQGILLRQGYILSDPRRTVRIRICNNSGFITIKGLAKGIERPEFEYEIPLEDADFLLSHICETPILEKIRYKIEYDGFIWEVDEFLGENSGLFVAEIELASDDQVFPKPPWIGKEVTGSKRYFNSSLVKNPYNKWA